jgi:phospholipid/cholesterol/gamma-HCH transport system substrate-binding protein
LTTPFDATRQLRVGLLVLACGATFVTLLAFIAGSTLRRDQVHYFILFDENVKGMVVGSKVNFQGVPIGSVSDIRFQAGRTSVEILVDPGRAEIQDVTVARLDRLLVTGQVTIELEGYAAGAAALPVGSHIEAASTDPIQELKTSLPAVLQRLDTVLARGLTTLERVDRVLSDANLERLEQLVAHVERAAALLPDELAGTAAEARATLAAFRPLAEDARRTFERLGDAADRAVAVAARTGDGVERALDEGRQLAGDARAVLARLDAMAGGFARVAAEAEGWLGNNRHAFRGFLVGAADAAREVQALARQLRAGPDALLFGTDRPEIAVPAAPAPSGR